MVLRIIFFLNDCWGSPGSGLRHATCQAAHIPHTCTDSCHTRKQQHKATKRARTATYIHMYTRGPASMAGPAQLGRAVGVVASPGASAATLSFTPKEQNHVQFLTQLTTESRTWGRVRTPEVEVRTETTCRIAGRIGEGSGTGVNDRLRSWAKHASTVR